MGRAQEALKGNSTFNFDASVGVFKSRLSSKLEGRKFRRQHSINNYIVDFFCPSERLIIELDGEGHLTTNGEEKDKLRTEYLENLDYRIVRFENKMIFENLSSVLMEIKDNFGWNNTKKRS